MAIGRRVGWGMDKRTREQLGSGTKDPDANLCAQSVSLWAILKDRAKIQERSPGRAAGSLPGPTCASWLYEAQSTTLLSRVLLNYHFADTRGVAGDVKKKLRIVIIIYQNFSKTFLIKNNPSNHTREAWCSRTISP